MQLTRATELTHEMMQQHGLTQLGWTFKFNRAIKCFGVCYLHRRQIQLSRPLVELNTEERVRDVILHEIAHALVPAGVHHGPVWKRMAIKIGAIPKTCYDTSKTVEVAGKWQAVCPNCGWISHKPIKPRNVIRFHKQCMLKFRRSGRSMDLLKLTLVYRKVKNDERTVSPDASLLETKAPGKAEVPVTSIRQTRWYPSDGAERPAAIQNTEANTE